MGGDESRPGLAGADERRVEPVVEADEVRAPTATACAAWSGSVWS
jgi:hypothetical protein